MPDRRNPPCLVALIQLSMPERPLARQAREAIDLALACDRLIHCGRRLQCTWMASELADRLRIGGA